MYVGPCMSTPALGGGQAARDLAGAEHRGERQVAAGQRLADAHDVGRDPRPLGGEQGAGAAEAGRDLVEDQQQAVLVGDLAEHAQALGGVGVHAAGALQHRLDDDRGQLVRVRRRRGARNARRPRRRHVAVATAGGRSAKTCWGSTPGNTECMPSTGSHTLITRRCRRGSRRAPSGTAALRAADGRLVLEHHLERHLDRTEPESARKTCSSPRG